ncbi:ABC transporter substrate-binding protein [Thioclava sp. 15-R06ZXC-3]|uniref:ABC transporter substrate-binding protein n=1 Tax=Thioclava arctica TaxID=3238301 RepID=A0ABV3TQW1_9RHOB
MTREELLRILSFSDKMRSISEKRTELSATDARWNIISYAMRRHLEGKLLTITSIASAADVPYGTAMRRIGELIEQGLLLKRARTQSGKSFSLHPTRKLIVEYESYAVQLKAMVGDTFGFNTGDGELADFYFGGSYMASRILSYPNAARSPVGYDKSIRILAPIDPTFTTLNTFRGALNEFCGTNIEVVNLPLDALHKAIAENNAKPKSEFDLISVDLPWIGQLAEDQMIRSLDDIIRQERYNASDFHSTAWKGSAYRGQQYGLPIQPTAELLFCRSDLVAKAGLSTPRTTEDVLLCARTLHRSAMGLSGIVMNYGRGTPVAHTFVQTLADFGQPVLDLAPLGDSFDVDDISGERLRPRIASEAGRRTAEYLKELLSYAHPDSMRCTWDRRIEIFARGEAALSYGWSVRAARFELDETSPAYRNVEFVPHPPSPGLTPVSPIGGFALAMPASLSDERVRTAWKVMEYLTRPEMMKWYVQNGNLTSPRFSTSADPEVQSMTGMIRQIDMMERRGELQIWPRPPVQEFNDLLCVLGTDIHAMLQGNVTIAEALNSAQNRVDAIMRAHGHY